MVPIRLIIMGWRKGVSRLDAALVDNEDEEAVRQYEQRKGTKHGILKVPHVLMNLFRKVGGGKKKKRGGRQAAADEQLEPHEAPQAVPLPGGNHASYAVV